MGVFRKWLEEMTSTASVAHVPMRLLSDDGRPYIGIPGKESPYRKPTIHRRKFAGIDDEMDSYAEKFPYKWLKYGQKTQILVNKKEGE